jgi:signal transduction histidine kinase
MRADERLRHVPVVVVTAREDASAIGDAFDAGATSFVVKPLNPQLLRYQLRYVLRAWRQEQEILNAKTRAEQAHAIKANVLRLVQHELRTPLTSIVGFAEHIVAHPRSSEVPEFATLIADAGRRFTGNIADLITAAQILTSDVTPRLDECAVRALVDAAVAAESDLAREMGVPVRVHGACDGVLECDRDLLLRALRHLVRNAIQHGAAPVDVMATRERETIVFAVRDRGRGIPVARLESCFDAFQQGDDALQRNAQGLGLGLPVARKVVEAHGGQLSVTQVEGVGCVALVTLPLRRQ